MWLWWNEPEGNEAGTRGTMIEEDMGDTGGLTTNTLYAKDPDFSSE